MKISNALNEALAVVVDGWSLTIGTDEHGWVITCDDGETVARDGDLAEALRKFAAAYWAEEVAA
jgi:hypothetical protein